LKDSPLTCTLMPGAWLAMSSRAVEDSRKTGRGSCGSGAPCGVSTQMRQPLMCAASAASLEIECLSVIAIASPAGSIPGAAPGQFAPRNGDGPRRQKAGRLKANPLPFASARTVFGGFALYEKRCDSDRQAQTSLSCEKVERSFELVINLFPASSPQTFARSKN
jgi:hypothetical protein